MNIDKMEAGPELDALMAERVMEWKPRYEVNRFGEKRDTGHWWDPKDPGLCLPPRTREIAERLDCVDCGQYEESWEPSQRMRDAWDVREKIAKLDHAELLVRRVTGYERNDGWLGWVAYQHTECLTPNCCDTIWALGDTAPLAICRAAWKAMDAKG